METNLSKIREQGIRLLVEGLGTVGAIHFMRQFESGSGDYTAEREKFLEDATIEEITSRIQERKKKQI